VRLTDDTKVPGVNAGKLVLSPTRTYAPIIKQLLDAIRPEIHGMIHCSGGAQTKILHFMKDNVHVIKDNLFATPPLFELIQKESGTDWAEMYKVFNMGSRMEVYLAPEHAQTVIDIAKAHGIDAQIVGRVEASDSRQLTLVTPHGTFEY
jgi:phosphoribosylformylglycinamidine cyclo-ligase